MDLLAGGLLYERYINYIANEKFTTTPSTTTTSNSSTTPSTTINTTTTSSTSTDTSTTNKTSKSNNDSPEMTVLYYGANFMLIVLLFICSVFASYLSWSCNTNLGMNFYLKLFYSFFAFLGGFSYIMFYIVYRVGTCCQKCNDP